MKNILRIGFNIFLLFCFTICKNNGNSQNNNIVNNNISNNMNVENFDIENFKKNAINNEYEITLPDGTLILQSTLGENYIEEIVFPENIYFQTYKMYNKNGILWMKGSHYKYSERFHIGTWYYYDENGDLVRENKNDDKIVHEWDKFMKLVDSLEIDLKNPFSKLNRNYGAEVPCYELRWKNGNIMKTILIDANTYAIIKECEIPHFEIE